MLPQASYLPAEMILPQAQVQILAMQMFQVHRSLKNPHHLQKKIMNQAQALVIQKKLQAVQQKTTLTKKVHQVMPMSKVSLQITIQKRVF